MTYSRLTLTWAHPVTSRAHEAALWANGDELHGVDGSTVVEEVNETRRNDGSRAWHVMCHSCDGFVVIRLYTGHGVPMPRAGQVEARHAGFFATTTSEKALGLRT